ncbi:MAG: YHS domain-containing (seleno)protein [Gammaproteobacteria bacterium]
MKKLISLPLTALLFLFSAGAFAGVDTETDGNDVILAGHDAVAYFTQNKPVEGSADYTATYEGAIYRFASAANRDTFQANPAKYAPAYGGYCALGTSFGKKFEIDGKAFEIVDGQLFVNKNLKVYKTWKKDIPGNIVKADKQWPAIADVPAADL